MDRIGLLAFSVFGVALLVLLARWLGFARTARLASAAHAADIARAAIPGLNVAEAVLAVDASGALVTADDGRVALVCRFGDRFVVRLLNRPQVSRAGPVLRIRPDEPMFPETALDLGSAAGAWAARL